MCWRERTELSDSVNTSMRDKIVAIILAANAILFAGSLSAHAQQIKTPLVGYLGLAYSRYLTTANSTRTRENEETFERGLRELGYTQGRNILIEWRFAAGKPDRLPKLAAELVGLKSDVIVTGGGYEAPLAVKNATTTIPIVFINISDPV